MKITGDLRRVVLSFCDTKELFQTVTLVCHEWRDEVVTDMRCWVYVDTYGVQDTSTLIAKWEERAKSERVRANGLRAGPLHLETTFSALGHWLAHDDGRLLSSLLSLHVIMYPVACEHRHPASVEEKLRCEMLERVCRISSASLQRLTWRCTAPPSDVPYVDEQIHHLLPQMQIASLSSLPRPSSSMTSVHLEAWSRLRHLHLDDCTERRSNLACGLHFPILESLTLTRGDTLPLDLLLRAPHLHRLCLRFMKIKSDEVWLAPPTLTYLEYTGEDIPAIPTVNDAERKGGSPRVRLLGDRLRELHTDSHLIHPPVSGLLSLPSLTDLSLCVDLPLPCTLVVPALLRLNLYTYRTESTFDCSRLLIGKELHSCRLNLQNRDRTIQALTHLATVPRPGCVVTVGGDFGSFGEPLGRLENAKGEKHTETKRETGGEEAGKDRDIVWCRSLWNWEPQQWYEHVARRDVLCPPLRLHSPTIYYVQKPDDEINIADGDDCVEEAIRETLLHPRNTPLLPIVRHLVQQGVIMLQEDFVVQYACPTQRPSCLCKIVLPASPSPF